MGLGRCPVGLGGVLQRGIQDGRAVCCPDMYMTWSDHVALLFCMCANFFSYFLAVVPGREKKKSPFFLFFFYNCDDQGSVEIGEHEKELLQAHGRAFKRDFITTLPIQNVVVMSLVRGRVNACYQSINHPAQTDKDRPREWSGKGLHVHGRQASSRAMWLSAEGVNVFASHAGVVSSNVDVAICKRSKSRYPWGTLTCVRVRWGRMPTQLKSAQDTGGENPGKQAIDGKH